MYEAVREVVEPKWSLEILVTLAEESPQNYTQIADRFETSTDVIAARLELLVAYGLVDRRERSHRDVRYRLTDRGERFLDELGKLDAMLTRE